jgi:hypothetical protein
MMRTICIIEETDHLPWLGSRLSITDETDGSYIATWSCMGGTVTVELPKKDEGKSYLIVDSPPEPPA